MDFVHALDPEHDVQVGVLRLLVVLLPLLLSPATGTERRVVGGQVL